MHINDLITKSWWFNEIYINELSQQATMQGILHELYMLILLPVLQQRLFFFFFLMRVIVSIYFAIFAFKVKAIWGNNVAYHNLNM